MRIFRSTTLDSNANTYVGDYSTLFVGNDYVLRISDNTTPGGVTIQGSGGVVQNATPPDDPTPNSLWYNTDTGRLYVYYEGVWVDAAPALAGPTGPSITGPTGANSTVTGPTGETGPTGTASTVTGPTGTQGPTGPASTGDITFTGNVIGSTNGNIVIDTALVPSGNATIDLGTIDNQWRSLYVSGQTVYLAGVPLSVSDGNTLSFGNTVVATSSNVVTTVTGNLTFSNTTIGTVNTDSDVNINVMFDGNVHVWTFDSTGNLTVPGAIKAAAVNFVYRGWYAALNQIYGDDPSINQIVLSRSSSIAGTNRSADTNDDTFTVSGLSSSSRTAVINLYGSNTDYPIALADIDNFVKTYIDLVLFDDATLRNTVSDIQTAFAANQAALIDSMPPGTLDNNFNFNAIQAIVDTSGFANTGTGTGAVFYFNFDDTPGGTIDYPSDFSDTLVIPGTGYAVDDVITVPGTEFGGTSPANDMAITVTSVLGDGIESWTTAGSMSEETYAQCFVRHFIEDGNDDQYDQGNFLGTNLSECEFTATTNADSELVVSSVEAGALYPFMVFYEPVNDDWIMVLWQKSGATEGGAGTYICGGYNSLDPNLPQATYTANGIFYGVNDTITASDAWNGGDYGAMVSATTGIFSLVAVNGTVNEFSYWGETGSDGDGGKTLTSPFVVDTLPVTLVAGYNSWTFDSTGALTFPTLTVDLHNGGVQAGSVLQFGNASQQAIITGPAPLAPGYSAQRLIIQGQNGGTGEGGDVYFWAGDADANGGDIKIYAGDADNVTTGSGGYINIDAGNGYDYGGDLTLSAGGSTLNGGDITLNAGYASGGTSGIIQLSTNGNTWSFGYTGNLTLPAGGTINYSDGSNALAGTGNVTFNDINIIGTGNLNLQPDPNDSGAYLDIYQTSGPDIHIAGNGQNLILGRDDGANVSVNTSGNVTIKADTGNAYVWTFDAAGGLTFPDNSVQTTAYTGSAATGYALTVGDINTDATHFDVVTIDGAGNTYYLGHTTGLTPGDSPFIIKVDSSGSVAWQTTLLYDGVVTAAVAFETTLALTFSDGDIPSQTWVVYINSSNGQVTSSYYYVRTVETIKVRDLVLGLSGGVPAWESVVGYFNSGTGGENSALIYFSSIGPSWTYSIAEDGAVGAVEYYGTATNPVSANVYAVGSSLTYGSVVSFYTPNDDVQWHKNIDLTQPLTITATSVAYSNGYIYVVSNNTDNFNDGFITKLDAITGAIIWQNGMGYGLTGEPLSIANGCVTIDGNGDIITAWNFNSIISQGDDILVVKFDTNGSVLWQRAIGTAGDEYHNVGDATEFLTADSSHYYIAMSAEDDGSGNSLGGALQLPLDGSGLGSYGNWLYSTQSWTVDPQDITGGSVDITANLIATPITLTQSGDQGAGVTNATLPTTLNLIGGGITTGDVTFDGINIIGTGNLHLQPDSNNNGAYLDIYLTSGPDLHLAGNGETVIIGRDSGANVSVNINGNVTVRADSGTPHVWAFGNDGNLTLPAGGTINYSNGSNALVGGGGGVTNQLVNSNYAFALESNGNLTLPPGGNINAAPTVDYGDGNSIVLTAGSTTGCVHVGGSVILNAGSGGASGGIERGGNILLNTNSGTWAFGNDGNLTFPTGNLIITPDSASFGNAAVISSADHNLITLSTGVNGGTSSLWVENYAGIGTSNIAAVYSNPVPGSGVVRIAVGQNGGAGPKLWDFDKNGNLTLPEGGQIVSASNTGNVVITASDGTSRIWTFEGGGNLTLPTSGTISYTPGTPSDWTSPAPTSIEAALNRLAAVVKVLNGGVGA